VTTEQVDAVGEGRLVSGRPTLLPWAKRQALGVGIGLLSIVGAMLVVFYEPLVFNHLHVWLLSGASDLWVQWRGAGLIPNKSGYSSIFLYDSLLKTPPGWELLISPIAHRFLAWPFPLVPGGWGIAHPRAMWIAGPTELAAVPFCLCAVDVWLRRLGASRGRRVVALVGLAVVIPAASLWGHPEDLMALACALLSLRAVLDDRWSAGWWMGAALSFQVEAVLVLPLCFVLLSRRRVQFVAESLALPLAVLAVPLIGDPHDTINALLHQSVFKGGIRYTPFHQLTPGSATVVDVFTLLLAVGVALVVWRRRDRFTDATLLWVVGVVYSVRLLYPSLYPYYLVPTMAVFIALSALGSKWRLSITLVLGALMTWWLEFAPVNGSWLIWSSALYPILVMGWAAFPSASARRRSAITVETELEPDLDPPAVLVESTTAPAS
jgi:hypothetical protein